MAAGVLVASPVSGANMLGYTTRMRRTVIAIVAIASLGVFAVAAENKKITADSARVVLTDQGFEPSEFSIQRGGTVTFSTDRDVSFWPASNLHPDHGIYPDFDPKRPLDPNETWTFTFDRPGDWAYHDHLRSYFTGVVHVVD